jgi:hypothetical protein
MSNAFGVDHTPIAKRSDPTQASSGGASVGRHLAAQAAFPFHGAVAGRKGHKLRATGNEVGGAVGGSVAGALIGGAAGALTKNPSIAARAASEGSGAGSILGLGGGVHLNNKRGNYKKQVTPKTEIIGKPAKVSKAFTDPVEKSFRYKGERKAEMDLAIPGPGAHSPAKHVTLGGKFVSRPATKSERRGHAALGGVFGAGAGAAGGLGYGGPKAALAGAAIGGVGGAALGYGGSKYLDDFHHETYNGKPVKGHAKRTRKAKFAEDNGWPVNGVHSIRTEKRKKVKKAFTEPVSKVGDWKTIDQRERSQRGNRKRADGAMVVGGAAVGLGAGTEARYPGATRSAVNNVKAIHTQDKALRTLGDSEPKLGATRAKFALRSAKAIPGPAKVVGGAALAAGGAAGIVAGARGANAYHQRKINQRRRANAGRVHKAFTEPVEKVFGGALFQGAAYAGKAAKAVVGGTEAVGGKISVAGSKTIGRQMIAPGAHAAKPALGAMGKTKIAGGLALQRTGSAIAAHPKATLGIAGGTTAGAAGMAGLGGHKR